MSYTDRLSPFRDRDPRPEMYDRDRDFYDADFHRSHSRDLDMDRARDYEHDRFDSRERDPDYARELDMASSRERDRDFERRREFDREREFDRRRDFDVRLGDPMSRDYDRTRDRSRSRDLDRARDYDRSFSTRGRRRSTSSERRRESEHSRVGPPADFGLAAKVSRGIVDDTDRSIVRERDPPKERAKPSEAEPPRHRDSRNRDGDRDRDRSRDRARDRSTADARADGDAQMRRDPFGRDVAMRQDMAEPRVAPPVEKPKTESISGKRFQSDEPLTLSMVILYIRHNRVTLSRQHEVSNSELSVQLKIYCARRVARGAPPASSSSSAVRPARARPTPASCSRSAALLSRHLYHLLQLIPMLCFFT